MRTYPGYNVFFCDRHSPKSNLPEVVTCPDCSLANSRTICRTLLRTSTINAIDAKVGEVLRSHSKATNRHRNR
jgi:hypothetical protein